MHAKIKNILLFSVHKIILKVVHTYRNERPGFSTEFHHYRSTEKKKVIQFSV